MNTVPGGSITGPVLWAAAKARVTYWNYLSSSRERVRELQEEILLSHCISASGTEFGRAHGLSSVRGYEDYKSRVPLRTYADFEPYLERMRLGERDVLWPGLVPYYGQSSGSSNTAAAHKFLPITLEQIAWQQKAGADVCFRYIDISGDRSLTGGWHLGLFPPGTVKRVGPVGVASNPGIMQSHLPIAMKPLALPRPAIRDIEDYDRKMSAICEAYLDYDVRAITGTTCWFSILFDRLIATARAHGRRVDTVSQIWPNLRVLFGGGVHAEPYRQIIDERIGKRIVLMDNYNATEGGVFAVTDRMGDDGMLIIPDRGVFFEFVPRSEDGKPDAPRVPLWRVEPGVEYSVVVTTCSGLYAYAIGDYIRFTSVFPHRVEFAGRKSGVLSVTQELTSYIELERAVAAAAKQHPCTMVDFTASSEVGVNDTAKGRYVLFFEFDREPADLVSFTGAVDRELCGQNRVYREHRAKDVAILPPTLVSLEKGATRQFMQALGQTSVQHKFPRIIDERKRDLLRSFARTTPASQPV